MTTPGAEDRRLAWLDLAKGACIALVVLHHVVTKYLPNLAGPQWAPVADAWLGICMFLKPLRMPLFFTISGFLAAGAVRRGWSPVIQRAAATYYLYLVWLAFYGVFYWFESTSEANRSDNLRDLAGELVWAETSMWFLFALAAYLVAARALRAAPPATVIAVAAALAVWTGWSGIEENNKAAVLSHFVFFAVGAYYPQLVAAGGKLTTRTLGRLAGAYLAGFIVLEVSGLPFSVTLLACGAAGVPLGLGVAARIREHAKHLVRGLEWLGQRTLRVYVLHFVVIAVLVHTPLPGSYHGNDRGILLIVFPIVIAAVVLGVCLLAYELVSTHGGQHLFVIHPKVAAAVAGATRPRQTLRSIDWRQVRHRVRVALWDTDPPAQATRSTTEKAMSPNPHP